MKPPLTSRQRRGAALAGIVGFVALNLGLLPGFAIAAIALFSAFLYLFGTAFGAHLSTEGFAGSMQQVVASVLGIAPAALPAVAIVSCVVGILLVVGSIVFSIRVLRRHGVNHPVGVTWAGIGLAGLVHLAATSVFGFVSLSINSSASVGQGASVPDGILLGGSLAATIIVDAVMGWLAWWWMAHTTRGRVAPSSTPAPLLSVSQIQ